MNEPLWPFIERKKSMRNLVKYVGIGLLVMGLAACDDKDTNATAQGSVAESNATGKDVYKRQAPERFLPPAALLLPEEPLSPPLRQPAPVLPALRR